MKKRISEQKAKTSPSQGHEEKMETEICHVCGKEKKPYTLLTDTSARSLILHGIAREDGPICERCNKYYAMTYEFKDASEEEFENAKKAVWFAKMMLKWWTRDKKLHVGDESTFADKKLEELENSREWEGTDEIAKWCRKQLNSSQIKSEK